MRISDILFITLTGICIYLIVNTIMEKKLLNLDYFNNLINQKNNTTNIKNDFKTTMNTNNIELLEKVKTKNTSSSYEIEDSNSDSDSEFNSESQSKISEQQVKENFIIESEEENNQINKENFISENTEDLINEVINQKNDNNQIILNN